MLVELLRKITTALNVSLEELLTKNKPEQSTVNEPLSNYETVKTLKEKVKKLEETIDNLNLTIELLKKMN